MPLATGARLGPYEILGPLGAGGMGEVYRARDPRLGREVAVKVLPTSPDSDQLRRLDQEARVAGALNHPNILAVHDVGTQDDAPYVVSELLEGGTLRERLESGALPVGKALDCAVQIARGLAAAHEKGIIHRDIKPDNLFLTRDGRVKILDFGLARVVRAARRREDLTQSVSLAAPQTEAGRVLGTVGYMSPEQVRGRAVDHRSDVFSFGVVLYEMLSGRRAFQGDSAVETMNAILKQEPPELSELARNLPPAVERVVKHCLEKDPDQRFQSARDLVFDCEALTLVTGSAPASAMGPVVKRRWLLLAAGLALLLSHAGVFVAGRGAGSPSQPSFRRLTFRPGAIGQARLAPDGHTVVYSAAWEGNQTELFSTRHESPETRSLGLPPAEILSISSSGEMAIALKRRRVSSWAFKGTLARVPLLGGVPREVEEDVEAADWSPDGRELAIVRDVGGRSRLEWPVGSVLGESPWISHPRISPRGDLAAFIDHPLRDDDRGSVAVVDRKGRRTAVSREWSSAQGLAWSPRGDEVWFTASDSGPGSRALHAMTLSGRQRVVERSAGGFKLHDVTKDGRALLAHENARRVIMGLAPGATRERDLSWLDWSVAHDLSADGTTLLFGEEGQGGGAAYAVCLRRTDGSPAVRLGEGDGIALSPDRGWALSRPVNPDRLVLLPTGPGQARVLKHDGLEEYRGGAWFPDGKRILFNAKDRSGVRAYVQGLDGAGPRAVTAPGTRGLLVSPDGKLMVTEGPDQGFALQPLAAGDPRPLPGLSPGEWPIQWSADGRSLFVYRAQEMPVRVYRLDLATGRKQLWKEIAPPEPAGVSHIRRVLVTPDGRGYVYDYRRFLSDLYLVEGLR